MWRREACVTYNLFFPGFWLFALLIAYDDSPLTCPCFVYGHITLDMPDLVWHAHVSWSFIPHFGEYTLSIHDIFLSSTCYSRIFIILCLSFHISISCVQVLIQIMGKWHRHFINNIFWSKVLLTSTSSPKAPIIFISFYFHSYGHHCWSKSHTI